MNRISLCAIAAFTMPALAADPPKPSQFGINPAGITSPEMRDALTRLHGAGIVEGSRGSLTFFRWADGKPPRLTQLGLWGPKANNDILAQVASLPDLESVSLYETAVDDAGFAAVAKLPKLKSLAITPVCRYEKAGFGPTQWSYPFLPEKADRVRITGKSLAGLPTLENLDLLDVRIEASDLGVLTKWPKLGSLALPNSIDAETVKHLQNCRKLISLTLGHREIAAAELEALAACKSIRKLIIIHARLSDDALQALGKLESVEELQIEDCKLTDDRLRHLRGSPKLKRLVLDRNEIAGPGLVHLAPLKLESLTLAFNNISDKTLADIKPLTTLENLGINYCLGITDAGIQSGTVQSMAHLKRINLRGLKGVTDASLDDLVKFGHLEHINIRQTKISEEGVERMKKAMPKTMVFK